jgi:CheY-like chemotaxis protein
MKVLVADDDPDQLALRCLLVERSGFETIKASDSDSAARLAEAHKPDCAVIDLRLPTEELGSRLIRELKRLNPAIHILVITGSAPEQVARQRVANLIDGVVVKGGGPGLLLQKLRSLAAGLPVTGN